MVFQYRKRYYPVATQDWFARISIRELCIRFNTASGITLLQPRRVVRRRPHGSMVSIPQAVWPSCNAFIYSSSAELQATFQYRKRYGPVATSTQYWISSISDVVSIPQAVWPSCNRGFEVYYVSICLFQYRKRYGPVATIYAVSVLPVDSSFNTASGMAQLQQCPWNPAPRQG